MKKGLLWLAVLEFQCMIILAPQLLGLWYHIMAGVCGGAKPITSWSGSKREKEEGTEVPQALQGHNPSDLKTFY